MKTLRAFHIFAAGLATATSSLAVVVVDNGSDTAHMNIRGNNGPDQ